MSTNQTNKQKKERNDIHIFAIYLDESHDLNSTHSCDSMLDNNPNQQFLHPPE